MSYNFIKPISTCIKEKFFSYYASLRSIIFKCAFKKSSILFLIFTLFIYFLIFPQNTFSQNINIIPQLKKIEEGKLEEAKKDLEQLKKVNINDPNVIFLEAVCTDNGDNAQKLYELIYTSFPKSQFADAALFRHFSYYYALGIYKKAAELKQLLEKTYPNSPYLKVTDKTFPETDEMIIVETKPYPLRSSSDLLYTVQAGAFSNLQNAQDLSNRFTNSGLNSKISQKTVNNLQLHIVTVGEFNNKPEAELLLQKLKNEFSIDGRIIKLE